MWCSGGWDGPNVCEEKLLLLTRTSPFYDPVHLNKLQNQKILPPEVRAQMRACMTDRLPKVANVILV